MKVYLRDRLTAGVGVGVLLILAAASYYYSLISELDANRALVDRDSPDFITTGISVTEFTELGAPKRRVWAEYAEHFADGRLSSIAPRMMTLAIDEPQIRASADTGHSMDGGETYVFIGNVLVTRAADREHAPMRFETTHMTVFPDTSRIETDAPVTMMSGSDITSGIGLTLDNVERTVDIHSHVRTTVIPQHHQ